MVAQCSTWLSTYVQQSQRDSVVKFFVKVIVQPEWLGYMEAICMHKVGISNLAKVGYEVSVWSDLIQRKDIAKDFSWGMHRQLQCTHSYCAIDIPLWLMDIVIPLSVNEEVIGPNRMLASGEKRTHDQMYFDYIITLTMFRAILQLSIRTYTPVRPLKGHLWQSSTCKIAAS